MSVAINLHEVTSGVFIDHCREQFGWRDLSDDVIMDVGCGKEGYCSKAILEKFPDVGTIIGVDINPNVISNFELRTANRMECVVADIENKESLRNYEARITKVISTHVFHQLTQREEAFRNVYFLLKPGGEAAFLFLVKSLIYDWLTEVLKNPLWKGAYQRPYAENLYDTACGTVQYKEMVEKIGFQVVECIEEKRAIPYPSDEVCKEELYRMCKDRFDIPYGFIEGFKENCFQIFLKLSARDATGRPCYRSTELSLLVFKPKEDFGFETKDDFLS